MKYVWNCSGQLHSQFCPCDNSPEVMCSDICISEIKTSTACIYNVCVPQLFQLHVLSAQWLSQHRTNRTNHIWMKYFYLAPLSVFQGCLSSMSSVYKGYRSTLARALITMLLTYVWTALSQHCMHVMAWYQCRAEGAFQGCVKHLQGLSQHPTFKKIKLLLKHVQV